MKGRIAAAVLLGVCLVAAFGVVLVHPEAVSARLLAAAHGLRGAGLLGAVAFAALVCLAALAGIVPGALLGIVGGAVYGMWLGFLTSGAGILLGALLAFLLARSLLRPLVAAALGRRARLAALDALVRADGWKIVLMLRISPVMPFSLTSYALGLSGISLRAYGVGTLAAMPPLLGYVVLGALGDAAVAATHRRQMFHLTLLGLGLLATLVLTIQFSRMIAAAVRSGGAGGDGGGLRGGEVGRV